MRLYLRRPEPARFRQRNLPRHGELHPANGVRHHEQPDAENADRERQRHRRTEAIVVEK